MQIEVEYSVTFKAIVEVADNATDQEIMDTIGDVDIPEGGSNNSAYVTGSYSLLHATLNGVNLL